jgi:hypothetical protein
VIPGWWCILLVILSRYRAAKHLGDPREIEVPGVPAMAQWGGRSIAVPAMRYRARLDCFPV